MDPPTVNMGPGETKTIHVVLALVIVFVAVIAGLFTLRVTDGGAVTNGVCTKIANMAELQAILENVAKEGVAATKICQGLDLPSETCTKEIKPSNIASQFFENNENECWEQVVEALCKDFGMMKMAKGVGEKYAVPEYAKICQ